MKPTFYLVRITFRSRVRRTLALVALIGLAAGLVLAVLSGARRTDTVTSRYLAAERSADAYLDYGFVYQGGRPNLNRIERLPEVATWSRYRGSYVVVGRARGGRALTPAESADAVNFLGPTDNRVGVTIDRHRMVAGHAPNPDNPFQVIVDTKAADSLGVGVGGTLEIRFWRKGEPISRWSIDADPRTTRAGPLVTLHVVGIEARVASLDWPGFVWMSPAFFHTYDRGRLMAWEDEVAFRLRGGEAELQEFRSAVAHVAGNHGYELYGARDAYSDTTGTFGLQAHALYLVAIAGALVAAAIIGQALARDAARAAPEAAALMALGMRRLELMWLHVARGAVIGAGAAACALVVALSLSPAFPLGAAGDVEPHPGLHVDAVVLAGTLAVFVGVTLMAALAGSRVTRRVRLRPGGSARSGFAERVIHLGAGPSAAAGLRMAFGRAAGAVSAGSAIAGMTVVVLAMVGSLVFAAGLRHLVDTPAAYGQAWDLEIGAGGAYSGGRDVQSLRHDPMVHQLMAGTHVSAISVGSVPYTVALNGTLVGVQTEDALIGPALWSVTAGRSPRAPDEVMLAAHTMAATHSHIGGSVVARHSGEEIRLRVVGEGVLVPNGFNGLGGGAAITYQGLRRLVPDAQPTVYRVRFDPSAAGSRSLRSIAARDQVGVPGRPARILALNDIARLPAVLVMLALLVAALAIGHTLFTSVRARRRDLAILKSLGFSRSQILAAVVVQSLAIALPAILLGTVLGIGVGRWAWRFAAEQLGVGLSPPSPGLAPLLAAGAVLIGAGLIALIPGRVAARAPAARVLRTE